MPALAEGTKVFAKYLHVVVGDREWGKVFGLEEQVKHTVAFDPDPKDTADIMQLSLGKRTTLTFTATVIKEHCWLRDQCRHSAGERRLLR